MQISSIISGLSDPTTWGKKNEAAAPVNENVSKAVDAQVQSNPAARKVTAEILRKFDVTNITSEQFMQMIQQLYKAGALSEKDYQELAAVRSDLEHDGIEPDEQINMLEHYSDKLSKAQKELGDTLNEAARQKSLGPDMRRLDWLQKFAAVQASPDALGLDIAA
jgi:hypothetical protein